MGFVVPVISIVYVIFCFSMIIKISFRKLIAKGIYPMNNRIRLATYWYFARHCFCYCC